MEQDSAEAYLARHGLAPKAGSWSGGQPKVKGGWPILSNSSRTPLTREIVS